MFNTDGCDRADWSLMQNGPINLFWRNKILEDVISSLTRLDYRILRIKYSGLEAFVRDVSLALKWKEQFGHEWSGNLNALDDALRSEPFDSAADSAFCIEHFNRLVKDDREMAHAFLDILAKHSRSYLLFGKRLIGLIQTSDVEFHTDALGGSAAQWNKAEWHNKDRGL